MNMPHVACFALYSILLRSSLVSTTLYRVYPSGYTYQDDSVTRAESASANCRSYPRRDGHMGDVYIHCDGQQLKLSDSERGSNTEYINTTYYVWNARGYAQLLFIFPTRVSLKAITLHYYSDSDRGRPRLRFYDVVNWFNVWDSPVNAPFVGIGSFPPDGEPTGNGNATIKIKANFNTKKVLMSKLNSSLQFAASEVEFFTNEEPITTIPAMTNYPSSNQDENEILITVTEKANRSSTSLNTITGSVTDSMTSVVQSNINIVAIGVSIVMLLILSTILIITATVLIWSYKRRSSKQVNNCSPYSTLNRRAGQPQSLQQDSPELYDQIHLSPSTGQAEYVPNSETANINNQSWISQNSHPIYSTAGGDIASALNVGNQATASQLPPQNAHESTSKQPTYAAVDSSKKKKLKKESEKEDLKCEAAKKGPPVLPYSGHEVPSASMQQTKQNTTEQEINSPITIEQLYTAVKKKPKVNQPKGEEEAPLIPPLHTVEELYTAVQKKQKSRSNADCNKDEIPLADDTETAPPIPPHTVEELYTAVMKKPKGNEEDENEAPPIPSYT